MSYGFQCLLDVWFQLELLKSKEGATRVELVTSRSAVECSATELYPQMDRAAKFVGFILPFINIRDVLKTCLVVYGCIQLVKLVCDICCCPVY